MSVEALGIEATGRAIMQSGFKKFIIYRYGAQKGAVPVFENIFCDSNRKCVDSFRNWGENLLRSNPSNNQTYEIFLFDEKLLADPDTEDPENEESEFKDRPKLNKKKSNRIRFTFQLTDGTPRAQQINGDMVSKTEIGDMIAQALKTQAEANEKNVILAKLAELEARLDGEEDEEREGSEFDSSLDKVNSILDRVENFGSKKKPAEVSKAEEKSVAVNGVEDISKKVGRDIKGNINKAITILYRHDKDLDLDLLKFSKIAEENPAQFSMFINALRKM